MSHYELLKVCCVFTPVYTRPKKKKKRKKEKKSPRGSGAPVTGSCSWVAEGQQTGPATELSWHLM